MITDNEIDELIQPIINLYNQMELELIAEVAKRFDTYDKIGGSLEWQIKKLGELTDLNADVIKLIAKYSKKSEKEILKMLNAAGLSNIDMEMLNRAYESGVIGVDPVKMLESPAIASTIELSYKELSDTYRLIQTKALESSRQSYMNILNTSYLDVASGTYDYQTSIKRAVGQMAAKGIEGATYKRGNTYVRYSIEGTVRRDTLTAVHQLSNKVTMQYCNELKCEYVETSQHLGARVHPANPVANHAGWQGKVFKIEGRTKEYPNLKEATGYPDDILGLGGVNCRHRMFPFLPGISVPNPIKYDEKGNERVYNLTQKQRRLEREIRNLKKKQAAAEAIGDKETAALMKNKLTVKYEEINKFCEQNGLKRDYSRELVSEQIKVKTPVANKSEKFYNSENDFHTCKITEQSIENLKEVKINGLTAKQCKTAFIKRKELLMTMKNEKSGTEGSVIFSLDDKISKSVTIGELHNTKIENLDIPYYAVHNHPDNGVLSPGDLLNFIRRKKMIGLESVGNDGKSLFSIVKTENSNIEGFYNHIISQLKIFKNKYPNIDSVKDYDKINEFSSFIFEEGVKYGFKITKI